MWPCIRDVAADLPALADGFLGRRYSVLARSACAARARIGLKRPEVLVQGQRGRTHCRGQFAMMGQAQLWRGHARRIGMALHHVEGRFRQAAMVGA